MNLNPGTRTNPYPEKRRTYTRKATNLYTIINIIQCSHLLQTGHTCTHTMPLLKQYTRSVVRRPGKNWLHFSRPSLCKASLIIYQPMTTYTALVSPCIPHAAYGGHNTRQCTLLRYLCFFKLFLMVGKEL